MQKHILLSLISLVLASCGGIPTKDFFFDAIDDDRQKVKCLIVIDDQWPENLEAAVFTPATIKVPFTRGKDSSVHVMLKPTKDIDAGDLPLPKDTDRTLWLPKERDLHFTYPTRHLFIMVRDLRN